MGYITSPVVKSGGLPMHLVKPLLKFVDIDYFVETGTAGGQSVREASIHFNNCHTIEIVPDRAQVDKSLTNVTWHQGNSSTILPKIVDEILAERGRRGLTDDEYLYSLHFLDAHYSGDVESPAGTKECPLMDEIVTLSALKTDAILIIDDARLFFGPPPFPLDSRQWPRIDTIICRIHELFPHYCVTLRDDYIIAYPERLSEPIDQEWRDNFKYRFPDAQSKLKTEVKNVWNAIQNYLSND